ncbi:DUF928 domain-containing protein [Oscillatoria laete-virens NRMC-F 0139]|nr:DUF928 domain-containing protein [Oscillatoria laete-virens]MDL5052056.1 DUF928 domain-containing protein [Oscillatoria laete-virens NRMC-F 0139]
MIKLNTSQLIMVLIAVTFSASPTLALMQHESQPLGVGKKWLELSASWGSLRDNIRRRRRTGGSRGEICEIAPALFTNPNSSDSSRANIQEIWSDRPLFIWQISGGTAQKIDLFLQGSDRAFWSREIPAGETKILYDGEPLKPGQTYAWQLSAAVPFPATSTSIQFQVMEPQKRDRISAELTAIGLLANAQNLSPERLALEKAAYFAERELWADALLELYSVENPSAELMSAIAQIQSHDFCTADRSNVSVSR